MNLLTEFLQTASKQADTLAIVEGNGTRISYGELAERSAGLATHWRTKGISKSDKVLIAMPVGIDLYIAIAALWRLGATIIFPEPAMGLSGLRNAIKLAKPQATVTAGWYNLLPYLVPKLWAISQKLRLPGTIKSSNEKIIEPVGPDHPALISFTSGSTGMPKGIVRSHGFLKAQNKCVRQMLSSEGLHTIDLVAFPVFVITNLSIGATSVLPNWKLSKPAQATSKSIAYLISREKVTRALIPPSICEALVRDGCDPGLKTIFTGGGPIFPDLMHKLQSAMPDTDVMAVYGSTEAEPIAHIKLNEITHSDHQAMRSGSGLLAGHPVPETRVKIIDDEIVVTGDHVNKGYLHGKGNAENKVSIDGEIWHRTGDAGSIDEQGHIWLRGRWSAGSNGRFPFELEVSARLWPNVRNVALLPNSQPQRLMIEGDKSHQSHWEKLAQQFGEVELQVVSKIPLDKRHGSKIDYRALNKLVASRKFGAQ